MHRSAANEQREKQSPAESSMSTLFESHHVFSSKVFQMHRKRTFRSTVDVIPIRFRRYDAYANYNPETHLYDDEFPILKRIRTLKLKFSREKASGDAKTRMERFARYKRIIGGSPREANKLRNKLGRYLSTVMGLPEDKQSFAIVQIMDILQAADLDKIIEVSLVDVIFRDTEKSLHLDLDELYYRAKLIPATESFIQALEEVSPPDDELVCAICMELFAQKIITALLLSCPARTIIIEIALSRGSTSTMSVLLVDALTLHLGKEAKLAAAFLCITSCVGAATMLS